MQRINPSRKAVLLSITLLFLSLIIIYSPYVSALEQCWCYDPSDPDEWYSRTSQTCSYDMTCETHYAIGSICLDVDGTACNLLCGNGYCQIYGTEPETCANCYQDCQYELSCPPPGSCVTNTDCNDGIICTSDLCSGTPRDCTNPLIPNCCLTDAYCPEGYYCQLPTTTGYCEGEVVGAVPDTYEGEDCAQFTTYATCVQGWPTHGCHWVSTSKGNCVTSIPHDYFACYDNDVYWYTSTGVRETKLYECSLFGRGCTGACSGVDCWCGSCITSPIPYYNRNSNWADGCECVGHDTYHCDVPSGDIYYYDSCGYKELDRRQDCISPLLCTVSTQTACPTCTCSGTACRATNDGYRCNGCEYVYVGSVAESCDGIDNDCDGSIDEGVRITYYRDVDGDGYGIPSITTQACSRPSGYSTVSTDCNDNNVNVWRYLTGYTNADGDSRTVGSAQSICSGSALPSGYSSTSTTADCNDANAAVWQLLTGYRDADLDTYTVGSALSLCSGASLPSGYRSSATTTDCNDANANIYPGRAEVCNGVDDNCNGMGDEPYITYYRDVDGDTYGVSSPTTLACTRPSGYSTVSTDCNDASASVWRLLTGYRDADLDTYTVGSALSICSGASLPSGYRSTSTTTDCNDASASVWRLLTGYTDNDGDTCTVGSAQSICSGSSLPSGYRSSQGTTDCNDANAALCAVCSSVNCYRDADGDGYGLTTDMVVTAGSTCASGRVTASGDCNDANANIYPGRAEVCNGVDDNCNGMGDEPYITYYRDVDGDTYGVSSPTTLACTRPSGYATTATDCNDSNVNVWRLLTGYRDADLDTCTVGSALSICSGSSLPSGYRSSQGTTDCNDANAALCAVCSSVNCYRDVDGDGYGLTTDMVVTVGSTCASGRVTTSGDCNDNNAAIHPGAIELCDGIDNNCVNGIDEGCGCVNGQTQSQTCYNGVGECNRSATQTVTCTSGAWPAWPPCPAIPGTPTSEVCDGLDNNCNGIIDDNIANSSISCAILHGTGTMITTCVGGVMTPTGVCIRTACDEGYALGPSNDCILLSCAGSGIEACTLPNGTGNRSMFCNTSTGIWQTDFSSPCILDKCNVGYIPVAGVCVIEEPPCGDNILNTTFEECDEGIFNNIPCVPAYEGDNCTYCDGECNIRTVYASFCGDNSVNGLEQCDDGNSIDTDACRNDCTLPTALCTNCIPYYDKTRFYEGESPGFYVPVTGIISTVYSSSGTDGVEAAPVATAGTYSQATPIIFERPMAIFNNYTDNFNYMESFSTPTVSVLSTPTKICLNDTRTLNKYCQEQGYQGSVTTPVTSGLETGSETITACAQWSGTQWYRTYAHTYKTETTLTCSYFPVCVDTSDTTTINQFCAEKGFSRGTLYNRNYDTVQCMRYTGGSWILSSGTIGGISCYYNIGTAYSANLAFTLDGEFYTYSCARDGVCVEDFSANPLCGATKTNASGIYYDPDCGNHTWQNCGMFQLRNGTIGMDCYPRDNRSYNAHTQCINPTDCVYYNSSGYNCIPEGRMLPVPGTDDGFIVCRAGQMLNGTTSNVFCPEEYEWSTNALASTNGVCRYPVNRCASVCPQVFNFSSSDEYHTLCNENLWAGSGLECEITGRCPTVDQCKSFEYGFVTNPRCFVNSTGTNNKFEHYCAPIISYPEYQYHNTFEIETI